MKVLVENYLLEGQPIGSKTLAQLSDLSVSSATIRNIMGELESHGFVESPHTSAGRVPTVQGYRLFVDKLLTIAELSPDVVTQVRQELSPSRPTQELLTRASFLLSDLTQMVGMVRVPQRKVTRIKQLEFMPLTERRILVILVLDDHEVQNRVIYSQRSYSREELQQAANYVNTHLAGKELSMAREDLVAQMQQDKEQLSDLMRLAIELAGKSLNTESCDDDYHLAGDNNLLDFVDDGDFSSLKSIFEAFRQKQEILALLDKALQGDGVQLFIGEESGTAGFNGCSVVTAPYEIEGRSVGVLAVVGPTRMPYQQVIPMVDITAKLLSAALNHSD